MLSSIRKKFRTSQFNTLKFRTDAAVLFIVIKLDVECLRFVVKSLNKVNYCALFFFTISAAVSKCGQSDVSAGITYTYMSDIVKYKCGRIMGTIVEKKYYRLLFPEC